MIVTALSELQTEIERMREELESLQEELTEYRCPYCGAPLTDRVNAPADPLEKHWGIRDCFACGYQSFGGFVEHPCPSDPRFPKFEDYELQFHYNPDEPHFKWQCYALPKTDMARRLMGMIGMGSTKEEAENNVREKYNRYAKRYSNI